MYLACIPVSYFSGSQSSLPSSNTTSTLYSTPESQYAPLYGYPPESAAYAPSLGSGTVLSVHSTPPPPPVYMMEAQQQQHHRYPTPSQQQQLSGTYYGAAGGIAMYTPSTTGTPDGRYPQVVVMPPSNQAGSPTPPTRPMSQASQHNPYPNMMGSAGVGQRVGSDSKSGAADPPARSPQREGSHKKSAGSAELADLCLFLCTVFPSTCRCTARFHLTWLLLLFIIA